MPPLKREAERFAAHAFIRSMAMPVPKSFVVFSVYNIL
jgi:hypothetical protein